MLNLRVSSKKQAKIKLALQGCAGSGKTYSALLLAYGLCNDWTKIAIIDSEHGSADLYAHLGAYNVLSLSDNFTPETYMEAIGICEGAGMEVIIIDSISQCWDNLLEYHAGLQGAYFFKKISGIKTDVDIASEFRYSDPFIDEKSLVIFISQSGETLDTIMAMKMAKSKGAKTLAITNVLGSTISREADMVIYTLAGPEISVASTKAYTAQVTLFYLLALYFGERKRSITSNFYNSYLDMLHKLSNEVEKVIENKENVREVAKKIKNKMNGFFIGRGIDDKCAREGSLKMKEITYIHTEAFSAGELKHGTIALIEEGTMVVAIATQEDMLEKMISNIKEVKARGAYVITLTKEKYKNVAEISDEIITIENIEDILAPTVANIVLQLLAYYTAVEKGLDVDKPRNLAKSVTVE